ncbi:MAG: hypothetical protein Q4E55_08435 [Bacteroidales bacterium]|nr:hypothetical protein [Bacteroidales bacterium]
MKRLLIVLATLFFARFSAAQVGLLERLKTQLGETPFSVKVEGKESDCFEMYGRAFRVSADGLKLWYDGTTLWNLKGDEVYVSEPDDSEFMPYQLFAPSNYGFTMTEGNKQLKFVKQDFSVIVWIGDNGLPMRVEVKAADTQLDLRLNELRKCSFKSGHFKFDAIAWPNVEVVDLR